MKKTSYFFISNPLSFLELKTRTNIQYECLKEDTNNLKIYVLDNKYGFKLSKQLIKASIDDKKVLKKTEILDFYHDKDDITLDSKEIIPMDIEVDCLDKIYFDYKAFKAHLFKVDDLELLKNNKYNSKVLDILSSNKLGFCSNIKSYIKESRYIHSVSVAKTAYKIAKKNKLDKELALKAYIAGLLHDVSKGFNDSYQYELGKLYSSDIDEIENFAYHQFASCYIANKYFNIEDKEILHAIASHCTGNDNMSPLDMIIYEADKVEPLREFKTEELRDICLLDYEKGFKAVLNDQMNYFLKNNIPFKGNKFSTSMYKKYLNK